jgi:phage repressor protein C with HTH and peptisase S24 domain
MEWITAGKLPKEAAATVLAANDDHWVDVTGYAQAAGLGSGPEAQEWAETHRLKFRKDSLARKRLRPESLAVMYGSGDSMEPTIKAGDAILFDTTDTSPKNRGIYVLLAPGAGAEEYIVKRAHISKGAVFFVADNPEGDHGWNSPRALTEARLKVVGRVRWVGGWVK